MHPDQLAGHRKLRRVRTAMAGLIVATIGCGGCAGGAMSTHAATTDTLASSGHRSSGASTAARSNRTSLPSGTYTVRLQRTAEALQRAPDVSISAVVKVSERRLQICWHFDELTALSAPQAADVRAGRVGVAGPVVTALGIPFAPTGCSPAPGAVIAAIVRHPNYYYLSLDTRAHVRGAVRGQL